MKSSTLPFRRYVLLLLGLSFAAPLFAQTEIVLHDKRVLVLGDSITNNGTYVSFLSYFLQKQNPNLDYDIISIGLGSETAAGTSEKDHPYPRPCIHSRLGSALEKIKPDIVFVCYGMNDGIYHPLSADRFLDYQDGIESLVAKINAANAHAIILTPPLFDASAKKEVAQSGASNFGYKLPFAQYNDVLRTYGKWIMLSELPVIAKIDLNTPMLAYNRSQRSEDSNFHLAQDGVHPGDLGHLIMAATILRTFGINIEGDLVETLAAVKADPLFEQINHRRQMRSKGWLDYVGYDRGKKVKTDSVDAIEAAAAKAQTAIDILRRS